MVASTGIAQSLASRTGAGAVAEAGDAGAEQPGHNGGCSTGVRCAWHGHGGTTRTAGGAAGGTDGAGTTTAGTIVT